MTAVMIGIDPHKGSHTAVAIGAAEQPLGELRVRASTAQASALVAWAVPWPERTWAVEGACGLGRLLARQLVAAGERVLDVPPKLASRVRLLQAGDTNKNDPNDALSVAVAALRSTASREVAAEDHAAVLKVWSKRHRDLARSRNQVACGSTRCCATCSPAASARRSLQLTLPASWGRSHRPGRSRQRGATWPPSSWRTCEAWMPSSATPRRSWPRPSGPRAPASPMSSASARYTGTVIGDVTDVTRFPSSDHFASYNGTAPVEVSSGNRKYYRLSLRGNRRINHALHMAAITQIRHAHSDGRGYYDRKIAEGKTHKEALRCLKRRISDAVFARLQADARRATATAAAKGPGGQPGNDSDSSAAGYTPKRQLFGQATPEPSPTLRPATPARTTSPKPTSKETRPNP